MQVLRETRWRNGSRLASPDLRFAGRSLRRSPHRWPVMPFRANQTFTGRLVERIVRRPVAARQVLDNVPVIVDPVVPAGVVVEQISPAAGTERAGPIDFPKRLPETPRLIPDPIPGLVIRVVRVQVTWPARWSRCGMSTVNGIAERRSRRRQWTVGCRRSRSWRRHHRRAMGFVSDVIFPFRAEPNSIAAVAVTKRVGGCSRKVGSSVREIGARVIRSRSRRVLRQQKRGEDRQTHPVRSRRSCDGARRHITSARKDSGSTVAPEDVGRLPCLRDVPLESTASMVRLRSISPPERVWPPSRANESSWSHQPAYFLMNFPRSRVSDSRKPLPNSSR